MASWTGAIAVLMGMGIFGVALLTMCDQHDKNSMDYQLGVAGIFVALLCVLFGIIMLKTGLGVRLFTSSAKPTFTGGGGGGGVVYGGGGGGYDYGGYGGGGAYY